MKQAAFDHMPMGEEGLKEIYSWIDRFVEANQQIVEKIILGKSEDNRWDVPAVVVTNRAVPEDEKQIAIITLTRHGNERGTRVVGPEILEYLVSDKASETRNRQIVVVVPVVNPIGMILDDFHSSLYGITDHEKKIFGKLCSLFTPDMMLDFHSLGKTEGEKYDSGDMEVIVPANTTRWGMDEQIYQQISGRLKDCAEAEGWPYEVHTLEDLNSYYFGDSVTGRMPQKYMEEKVFLLHIQNAFEQYDFPPTAMGYTNYTNGPAYMKWHTMVFGVETNHWSIKASDGLGESGCVIARELLDMGNERFPWEKNPGYPTHIINGDFRISVRSTGKTPGERRSSREKLWSERARFHILKREMLDDPGVTLAQAGYMGDTSPIDFDFCLKMRQDKINSVSVNGKKIDFETFTDGCSTFVSIPIHLDAPGILDVKILHEVYKNKKHC